MFALMFLYSFFAILEFTQTSEIDRGHMKNTILNKNNLNIKNEIDSIITTSTPVYLNMSISTMSDISQSNYSFDHTNMSRQFIQNKNKNSETDLLFLNNSINSERIARLKEQTITFIQINLNSQLMVNPGSTLRIVFDVTNLHDQSVYHNFQVTDERSWLINFHPRGSWIMPKQTLQVTVLAQVPQTSEIGLSDKITLVSNSLTVASQAVSVRVVSETTLQDSHRPYIHYTFGARCDGKRDSASCSSGFWTLEITTQDSQSGILRIESDPIGLFIRTPFVAGTRNDVRATFSASCCQPRVTVTSYDVSKNPSTFSVNVHDIWLSSAGIAAVTCGVLLGILLLLILIFCILWFCCRNRQSRDLPVYRSDSSRSTH